MFYLKTIRKIIKMSIQIISTADNITINETLKDDITIYEYIKKVVDTLGDSVDIVIAINTGDKLITVKIK